jgi:hypothetical protein
MHAGGGAVRARSTARYKRHAARVGGGCSEPQNAGRTAARTARDHTVTVICSHGLVVDVDVVAPQRWN